MVLFRRLAVVTALFAYLQIALGGVVRLSGSGLGCPDWPLCHGRPYPPANVHSIIEYSHRTVGSITGVLIVATVILAWVLFRQRRPEVAWIASASLVAIAAEGGLGALVVASELAPWLVLVHLGLAMIILGCLVATAVMAMPASAGVGEPAFRRLTVIAAAATFVMLLTGSTVVASGADRGCNSWPLCGGGFALSFAGVDAFTMLHRGAVLVVSILLVYVLLAALRRPGLAGAAIATLVALALQIAVGAGAAVTDAALFSGFHVAIATLVWAGILSTTLLTLPRVDRVGAVSMAAEKSGA
ncbi:MAG TPA: COX15/CtaA family protein [Candidatus Dormibacteraeota bacterium]